MIEQALLVILGAAGASLLWMALLPAIAERARRLAQARTSLPANAAQAAAERDLLRAQQAVEIVRAERRVEAAETIAAKARAEVGRFAIDRAELAAMETRARESESEAGTAKILVADFAYQRERSASDLLEARRGVEERELAVDGLRTQLAAASARAGGFEIKFADAVADLRKAKVQVEAQFERAQDERSSFDRALSSAKTSIEEGQTRIERLVADLERLTRERDEARRRLDESGAKLNELGVELNAVGRETHRWRIKSDGLEASLTAAGSRIVELQRRPGDPLAAPLRLETTPAKVDPAALASGADRALREAITRLGRQVLAASRADSAP